MHVHINIKVTRREVDGVSVIDCAGKVKAGANANYLHGYLVSLARRGVKKIVLNLAGVDSVDGAGKDNGVERIMDAQRILRSHGGDVRFLGLQPEVERAFVLAGVALKFETYATEQEAIRAFNKDESSGGAAGA